MVTYNKFYQGLMTTGKRYYVSVNFICDTDGSEKDEPSIEQLDEAFRTMLKESQPEFEIWDVVDQEEMS